MRWLGHGPMLVGPPALQPRPGLPVRPSCAKGTACGGTLPASEPNKQATLVSSKSRYTLSEQLLTGNPMTSNAPDNPAHPSLPSGPRLWQSLLDEAVFAGLPLTTNSAYLALKHALASGLGTSQTVPPPAVPHPYRLPLRQECVVVIGGPVWRVVDANGMEVDDATIRALAVHASHPGKDVSNEVFRKAMAEWRKPGGLLDGPFA